MYFFAGSIVIGGSLDQLMESPDGAEADEVSELDGEAGAEVCDPEVPEASEDPVDAGDPAAELIVPLEAQPDSSNAPIAATTPMPTL